jgi:hypothetical protein
VNRRELTPQDLEAIGHATEAAVMRVLALKLRPGGPDTCGARFPFDEGGRVRCGRERDHVGAHEFRWLSP